jgi:hypothetical protein
MVKRIESEMDTARGVITYDLGDGRYVTLDALAVQRYGAVKMLRAYGVGMPKATDRVVVMQDGRRVGTAPGDFDPYFIKSTSFMYDPRPGDFKREGDVWVASRMLGGGDLECVPGFVWSREP